MTDATRMADVAALRRRLADLPVRARAEMDVALRAIGQEVLVDARATLATGPGDPKGMLAASLIATLDPGAARLTIASASPAAVPIEFGTRRAPARPFLRPAVEAAREAVLGHFRAALARALGRTRDIS